MEGIGSLASTANLDAASSDVAFNLFYSLRVELVCVFFFGAMYFMGTFTRPRVPTTDKPSSGPRSKQRPAGIAGASASRDAAAPGEGNSAAAGAQSPQSNTKILRELATAECARLCDAAWVVPRIVQLCPTHMQNAMESYRMALKAGLNLKGLSPEDCSQLFTGLVTSSIRINQTDSTLELLRDLRNHGTGIIPGIFSSVVKLCTSRHFFEECLSIYDFVMTGDGAVEIEDKSIWSCLLFCAVETKSWKRCQFFFDQLVSSGTPSQKDYWNMIRFGASRGDWELLVRLLQDMSTGGVKIDSIIYNTVLSCCVSSNQIHHARRLLEEMADAGSVTDVITYNTLLKGYAKNGDIDNCFELCDMMRARNIKPSQVTFGILLDACINENQLDRASEVFTSMSREGVAMNTVLYTTLIKGFARVGKLDEAMKVYTQMSGEASVPPDLITFSILIKANADAGRMEAALEMLSATLRHGLKPDEVVFNNLIAGCAKQGNAELARRLYSDMVSSGIPPSNATFSILIRLYSQCKCLDEAVDMLRTEPSKHGVEVEPRLFAQLVQCCIRARQGRRAVEVYEQLAEQSVPSAATNGSLVGMCVKLNMFDTAVELIGIAAACGGRVHKEDIDALLEAAARKRKPEVVEACVAAMKKLGLPVPKQLMTNASS